MTDRLTDEEISEIREREKKAPGKRWEARCEYGDEWMVGEEDKLGWGVYFFDQSKRFCEFVAHARTDIPRLLGEVERLRKRESEGTLRLNIVDGSSILVEEIDKALDALNGSRMIEGEKRVHEAIEDLLEKVEHLRVENQRLSIAIDHGQEASDAVFEGLKNENSNLALLALLYRERVESLGGSVGDIDARDSGKLKELRGQRAKVDELEGEVERLRDERDRYRDEIDRLRTGTDVQRALRNLSDDELRDDLECIAHDGAGKYVANLAAAALNDELKRRALEATDE